MGSHPPRFTTMASTRVALLAAPFLLLIIIGASQAQPRTGRQDEEAKEEMTTTTQASTTTTKATMVEETNEVIDPMEQCDKCRKPRYRARNGDFCSEECPEISAGGLVDKSNMVDKAEVEPTVVTSAETDEAKELGVLGSIFKFLVEANTWGEVPASIPSAAEVEVEEEEEDNDLKEDV